MKIHKGELPSQIEPDGIIESVVIVRFETDISKKRITEIAMSAIKESGCYSEFREYRQRSGYRQAESEYRYEPSFFSNGNLKIQINDDSIAFNCAEKYLRWEQYKLFIQIVISALNNTCMFNYAELHYVSKFDDVSILEYIDGEIKFNQLPMFAGTELKFGYDVIGPKGKIAEAKVILTSDKLYRIGNKRASFVDIRLRSIFNDKADFALERIEDLHYHEKYAFFSLLSDKFFEERGVKYGKQ